MPAKLITAPDSEPVTVDDAKGHLSIDVDDTSDDDLIEGYVAAAREQVESYTGRVLMPQAWDLYFDAFPSRHRFSTQREQYLELDRAPLQSIDSIKYFDVKGVQQTLAAERYYVDDASDLARIYASGGNWPSTIGRRNAVILRANLGYADADSVPKTLKLAIKMLVSNFYENREPVALVSGAQPYEMPINIQSLLSGFKVNWIS